MNDDIRAAAFARAHQLNSKFADVIPWPSIVAPISTGAGEFQMANRARGIFRPRQMERGVLSIKTTIVREGLISRNPGCFHFCKKGRKGVMSWMV